MEGFGGHGDGRSAADAASGLRPLGPETAKRAQAEPLVPNAGQWILFRSGSRFAMGVAEKVTPKTVKLDRYKGNAWERQISRDQVAACCASKEEADKLRQSLDGVQGEYARRCRAAREECRTREIAAHDAFEAAAARLIRAASGTTATAITTPSGEEGR